MMSSLSDKTSLLISDVLSSKRLGQKPDIFLKILRSQSSGLPTGLPEVDRQLLGLRGLVGILGEPKCCKSTLALQVAAHNARRGIPAYIVDRENGKDRITRRLLCQLFNVSAIELNKLPDEKIKDMLGKLGELPIFVTNDTLSFDQIDSDIEALFSKEPEHVLLIVDSLQSLPQNLEDIRLSVDDWLLRLDALKLRYSGHLTILITVEKSRAAYGMASRFGGKESGRIEYKLEQQLDLRLSDSGEGVILECTLNRDGAAGMQVGLRKVYKNDHDPNSFLFRLTAEEGGL